MAPAKDAAPLSVEIETLWSNANRLQPGSQGWRYLVGARGLPEPSVERARQADALREGIYATIWFQHINADGCVSGWEMRGPNYKGFSKGGRKSLFRLGDSSAAERVAVTESAIDAISLASLEKWPGRTVYVSTGGGFGPGTIQTLQALLANQAILVAATDRGVGGDKLAEQLHAQAIACGVRFSRFMPTAQDWNDQLRGR
jgi:hypothetical protein